MIVPMKKVSLVILNKDKETALKVLRKSGLVHLEKIEGTGDKLADIKNKVSKLEAAAGVLESFKAAKKGLNQVSCSNDEAFLKAERTIEIQELKKSLFEKIANDTAEKDRLEAWGKVDPQELKNLSEKGVYLSLYEIPSDKYQLIGEDIQHVVVNKTKGTVRFLLVSDDKNCVRPEVMPPEAYEVVLPEDSTDVIAQRIVENKSEIVKLDKEVEQNAYYFKAIKNYNKLLQKDIEFETIFTGMENDGVDGPNSLSWLTGYVPADEIENLKKIAEEQSWAIAYDDPSDDDEVPTKLKNNKFVSLIYPLTDFLGTIPGYKEYDISGWFLLFFTIFFGMIFGDGGYGLLVTLISFILLIKNAATKKPTATYGLVCLVGFATVVWGFVTCTWFGLTPEQLENNGFGFLTKLTVPAFSNAFNGSTWALPWTTKNGAVLDVDKNLQIFCFSLALLQLSIAHLKAIGRNMKEKSLKWIGDFGALIQLWGMFYVVLSMVVSAEIFPLDLTLDYAWHWTVPFINKTIGFNQILVGKIAIILIASGFALSFIFSNFEGNIFQSILASVKNIISVLLGVVNVFSDIVSYIRLWAVGLAGAAISGTVNTMAGPMVGHAAMFVFLVLLLVFGHGMNMVLNLLSVIVHGVRLNTLEFSSHLGMSWSGFKYEPFSETVEK